MRIFSLNFIINPLYVSLAHNILLLHHKVIKYISNGIVAVPHRI